MARAEEGDLERLAASSHHEGVVADVLRVEPQPLDGWLHGLGPAALALWLDGVGNPHNFGAILRSAAHFGVAGILLPRESTRRYSVRCSPGCRVISNTGLRWPTLRCAIFQEGECRVEE